VRGMRGRGEGVREKGEGRREKGEGRREKGEGRRGERRGGELGKGGILPFSLFSTQIIKLGL
jgi:hypothetical protein